MKVRSKAERALRSLASPSRRLRSIRSILLRTRIFGRRTSGSFCRIASFSSSIPFRTSMRSATTSASPAPLQADDTMARSSRRFGLKRPGVATNTIWASPSTARPRTGARVVCTLRETIETFEPTSALSRVDLPAFGTPISAVNPQRVRAPSGSRSSGSRLSGSRLSGSRLSGSRLSGSIRSAMPRLLPHALAKEKVLRGVLFRRALRRPLAQRGFDGVDPGGDAEHGRMVRSRALDHVVGRGRKPPPLRPLLQGRLRVADGLARGVQPLGEGARDERLRRLIAAVEKHRADHRLAYVGQDGAVAPPPRARLTGPEMEAGPDVPGEGDVGAGVAPDEVGEAARHLAFRRFGESQEQQLRDGEAEHPVPQE